jgi:hypothetical protein
MKLYKSLLLCLGFIFLLLGTYYIHILFFKVNVVLYSAILDSIIASTLATILIFSVKWFNNFNRFEKTQLVVIWLLTGYIFAISIPAVIDRSFSFYILEKIQQRGGGIKLARFDTVIKEFMQEHQLNTVRLTEQQESGTIIIENGCVKLTRRGDYLATFSRFFKKNFLPKHRLLMGKYSDDLTDPFRNSQLTVDYSCK